MIHGIIAQGASAAAAPPAIFPADLKLLLRMEGANNGTVFVDSSPSAHIVSPQAGAITSTTRFIDGASSHFVGGRLLINDSADFDFGTGAFTVFAWTFKTNSNFGVVVGQRSGDPQWNLGHANGAFPEFQMATSPSGGVNITGGASNSNAWTAMAATRNSSGLVRLRQNGTVVASATNANAMANIAHLLSVGSDAGGGFAFAGNTDLVFIVKGVDLFDTAGPILSPLRLTPTPEFLIAPVITAPSGRAVGNVLSCTSGFAWPNALTYTYQWLLDGAPISGETGSTYTIRAGDDPNLLSCRVSNNGGFYDVFVGHRYWRIAITANNGSSFTSLVECQFHTRSNNGDETGNGVGSASSNFPGGSVANAFNRVFNNSGNYWATVSGGLPAWLAYDFGAGQVPDIRRVSIASRAGGDVAQAPRDFTVQWSDDGSTWTTAWAVTGATGWSGLVLRYFDKP